MEHFNGYVVAAADTLVDKPVPTKRMDQREVSSPHPGLW